MIEAHSKERTICMSDNFENRNDLTPETTPVEPEVTPVAQETPVAPVAEEAAAAPQETEVKPDAPVEGEYRFRTYDLNRRQEPQATFGNADWQWQPAEAVEQPRKKRKKIRWGKVLLSSAAVILAAAICFGAGYAGVLVANSKNTVIIQQVSPGNSSGPEVLPVDGAVLTSAQVAAKVESSVVAITTEHMTTSNYWFGNYVTSGAGSGVIISEDGYILTCAHVIDGASKVTVELQDGETATAKVVGSYTNGDIAVIKIEKAGLTPAAIADSDSVKQGETCYAVGNPEGRFSGSISDGIVSALDRTISIQVESSGRTGNSLYDMFYGGNYTRNIQLNVLQMTAAVSPGNSGGALFNDRGQLIGIVSAKSAATDSEGLGFAIPSNDAMEIASQLIANGVYVPEGSQGQQQGSNITPTTNKAVLGITVQTLDTQQAYQYNMTPGVYISDITVASTREAGLKIGDRLISVDDVLVNAGTDVTDYLATKNVGDVVQVSVERSRQLVRVNVTLVENGTPAA